jgi:predicted negative regulator of RcsB-dependent stress response
MKSMKNEELDLTLQKMDDLAKKSDLPNVDQFKATMIADGFSKRKNYTRAIQILSDFYQTNPTRPDVKQVTQRIVKNISDELKNLSDKGDYKNLLQTHRQYADTWLKTQPRIDTDYLLGLSYEHAGAYDVAIQKYKKVFDGITAIKGTATEKEVYVDQYLPTMDSLYLRLAKNNFENHNPQESYSILEKIQKPLALTDEEQVERVVLASDLYEKKGDSRTAIRYLSELSSLWKGDENLSLPVQFKLAEMQVQKGDIEDAIGTYEKCSETLLGNAEASEVQLSKLANSYSKVLIDQGRNDDAAAFLNNVIKKFGNKYEFSQERYVLGDLLFKKGEFKKAEQAWAPIKDTEGNVWRKLSQEKLKQASWDENYKNHIRRIPAMSQLEEEK